MLPIVVIVLTIVAVVFGGQVVQNWRRETAWRRKTKRELIHPYSRD